MVVKVLDTFEDSLNGDDGIPFSKFAALTYSIEQFSSCGSVKGRGRVITYIFGRAPPRPADHCAHLQLEDEVKLFSRVRKSTISFVKATISVQKIPK
jgi:hypothetical protein